MNHKSSKGQLPPLADPKKTPRTDMTKTFTQTAFFPRTGDDVIQDVREILVKATESMRGEVVQIMHAQEDRMQAKLDSIFDIVRELSDQQSSEQAREKAAAAIERTNQHTQLMEQLTQVAGHLENVQKKSDFDDLALRLLERMDLPGIFDIKMTGLTQKLREFQMESKAHTAELSRTVEEVRGKLVESVISASKDSMVELAREIQSSQDSDTDLFEVLLEEMSRILQSLNLDYLPRSKYTRSQPDSAHKDRNPMDPIHNPEPEESQGISSDVTAVFAAKKVARKYNRSIRLREFGMQTENQISSAYAQTDADLLKGKKKKPLPTKPPAPQQPSKLKEAEELKAKARLALIRPQYNVQDYYYTTGFCQRLARSRWFENITVGVVLINAIWIAVEIDTNKALVLSDADPFYQVVENLFCAFFFVEVCIRFFAFARKRHAFQDMWFVFDSLIVFNMVVETWMIPVFLMILDVKNSANMLGNLTMLRMVRMVKLLRLSRLSKILRTVPELVIIIKAIGFASRSVAIFSALWLVVIYFFAVVMRQLTAGTDAGLAWFSSVPRSMNTLLLHGILPDYALLVNDISDPSKGSALFGIVLMAFIVLASVTIMYMLVGVLVEVVSKIASDEKENLTVSYLAAKVREKLESGGRNVDIPFKKPELQQLIMETDMVQLLISLNVDIVALMDMFDIIYEDIEKDGSDMTFQRLVDVLLNGRGTNQATVRDTKDVLRSVKQVVKATGQEMVKQLHDQFAIVHSSLSLIRDEVLEGRGEMFEHGEAEYQEDS
eukprot:TRINITY_DN2235_c0_g1_i1.p1 TRINITY_DN2235_c0_g1~~TRINITY_DN2235_c0_g1_i1.p1  ORF type:complete len:778 (+),score=158.01 TRINITY_DN2235_c0_g1_i1:111-2444(+)